MGLGDSGFQAAPSSGGPALSDAVPLVESGSGSAGTSAQASRADHVHPAAAGGSTPPVGGSITAQVAKSNGGQFNRTFPDGTPVGTFTSPANSLKAGFLATITGQVEGSFDLNSTGAMLLCAFIDGAEAGGPGNEIAFTFPGNLASANYQMDFRMSIACISVSGSTGTFQMTGIGRVFNRTSGVVIAECYLDVALTTTFTLDVTATHTWDLGTKFTSGHGWSTTECILTSAQTF